MEFVLVHRPIGLMPPEAMKPFLETAKKLCANPQAFVPGSKLIGSYYAIGAQVIYCIWDVPNIEALAPLLRNMSVSGWNTEVVPAEKAEVALANIAKAMEAIQAQMMGK